MNINVLRKGISTLEVVVALLVLTFLALLTFATINTMEEKGQKDILLDETFSIIDAYIAGCEPLVNEVACNAQAVSLNNTDLRESTPSFGAIYDTDKYETGDNEFTLPNTKVFVDAADFTNTEYGFTFTVKYYLTTEDYESDKATWQITINQSKFSTSSYDRTDVVKAVNTESTT